MGQQDCDLAIVIVTYNSERTLHRCLESVTKYAPRQYRSRCIVVDNASSDKGPSLVNRNFPHVDLVRLPENAGFGAANNIAMSNVTAKFYYLHNADAYLTDNVLDRALDYLMPRPEVGVAGLPLVFPDGSAQTAAYGFSSPTKWLLQLTGAQILTRGLLKSRVGHVVSPLLRRLRLAKSFALTYRYDGERARGTGIDVDWVCGASMFVSRAAFEQTGGFDTNIFLYGEDEDLCISAREAGFQVEQLQLTPVIHEFGWGQSRRTSRFVSEKRYQSIRYFITKRFRDRPLSRMIMLSILYAQRLTWSFLCSTSTLAMLTNHGVSA